MDLFDLGHKAIVTWYIEAFHFLMNHTENSLIGIACSFLISLNETSTVGIRFLLFPFEHKLKLKQLEHYQKVYGGTFMIRGQMETRTLLQLLYFITQVVGRKEK